MQTSAIPHPGMTVLFTVDSKFVNLTHFYIRLEEKLSNSESENQVLRQQALTMSPTGKALSGRPKTVIIQVSMEYMVT